MARDAIAEVVRAHPELYGKPRELLKLVDAAYPFGQRQYHPYKVWLSERKRAMAAVQLMTAGTDVDVLMRVCRACGAGINRRCRMIHNPLIEMIDDVHAVRRGESADGPLFETKQREEAGHGE